MSINHYGGGQFWGVQQRNFNKNRLIVMDFVILDSYRSYLITECLQYRIHQREISDTMNKYLIVILFLPQIHCFLRMFDNFFTFLSIQIKSFNLNKSKTNSKINSIN